MRIAELPHGALRLAHAILRTRHFFASQRYGIILGPLVHGVHQRFTPREHRARKRLRHLRCVGLTLQRDDARIHIQLRNHGPTPVPDKLILRGIPPQTGNHVVIPTAVMLHQFQLTVDVLRQIQALDIIVDNIGIVSRGPGCLEKHRGNVRACRTRAVRVTNGKACMRHIHGGCQDKEIQ